MGRQNTEKQTQALEYDRRFTGRPEFEDNRSNISAWIRNEDQSCTGHNDVDGDDDCDIVVRTFAKEREPKTLWTVY